MNSHNLEVPFVIPGFIAPSELILLKDFVVGVYGDFKSGTGPITRDFIGIEAMKWGGLPVPKLRQYFKREFGLLLKPIIKQLEARFEGAVLLDAFSGFRAIWPDRTTYIYWHMDADGGGSGAHEDAAWNCWIPLEDVGEDYPSLETIPHSEAMMRKFGMGGENNVPGHRSDQWVDKTFEGYRRETPNLKFGDAYVFSHWVLHRTQVLKELKGPRIGAEMRFSIRPKRGWFHKIRRLVVSRET